MYRVAVVGGGISGIAAAITLQQTGKVQVALMESSNRLGGVLETIQDGDYLVERSADNFSTLVPDALNLSEDCGLAGNLIQPNRQGRQAFVYLDGQVHPIPSGFSLMQPTRVWPIVWTKTLSWRGKMRMLREYWVPPRPDGVADESLESFAIRRLGREAFEKLVEPIVGGIFTADAATLSMAATMPQFLEMERKFGGLIRGYRAAQRDNAAAAARRASGARYDSFVAPRGGMSSWISGLTHRIPDESIRLHTRVAKLQPPNAEVGGSERERRTWRLDLENTRAPRSAGSISSEWFDAVILATPAAVTSQLLVDGNSEASRIVGGISYASSAVVAMVINRSDVRERLDGFGLVVPRREHRAALAISFTSNKYPGRVPDDQLLIRIFLGGAARPEIVDGTDADLIELAYAEAKTILGWQGRLAEWQTVIRWKDAMPQYLVGHVDRMKQLEHALASQPTLRVCGAAYRGVGIPQCVASGKLAAGQILESLRQLAARD